MEDHFVKPGSALRSDSFRAEQDVSRYVEMVEQARLLEYDADPPSMNRRRQRAIFDRFAIDHESRFLCALQASHAPEKARLAGTGYSEESRDSRQGQVELDIQGKAVTLESIAGFDAAAHRTRLARWLMTNVSTRTRNAKASRIPDRAKASAYSRFST